MINSIIKNIQQLSLSTSTWIFSFTNFGLLLVCQYSYCYTQLLITWYLHQWENEIYLLLSLIIGFVYYFILIPSYQTFLKFYNYTFNIFFSYLCLLLLEIYINWLTPFFLFSSIIIFSISELLLIIFICVWILISLKILFINMQILEIFYIELIFSFSFFSWLCLFSIIVVNFFLILYIFELITVLVIISALAYLKIFGYKLVKASIQFFILNLIFSAIYIFSLSLLYLYTSNTNFTYNYILLIIYNFFENFSEANFFNFVVFIIGLKICCVILIIIFIFKLTLAPISIWIVQVYNYIPYFVLIILITIYKIIYIVILVRIIIFFFDIDFFLNFSLCNFNLNLIFIFFIVPSFFIGCISYNIQNIKIILALTTVSQFGYIFIGLLPGTLIALKLIFLYLLIYSLQIYIFLFILIKYQRLLSITQLSQLAVIKNISYGDSLNLIVICLVFIGLPPFSGFFIKYFLFLEIFNSGFEIFVSLALISNFLLAPIYLNIILQLLILDNYQFSNLKLEIKWNIYISKFSWLSRVFEIFLIIINCLFIFILEFIIEGFFIFIQFFI